MTTTQTIVRPHETRQERYSDGVSVEELFEDIYRRLRMPTAERGIRLRFDVIAWQPLTVAANHDALTEVLETSIREAMTNRSVRSITLRAFPCPEDLCILFEVLDDRTEATNCIGSINRDNFHHNRKT